MKRFPHTTPWAPAIGFAAVAATIATMGIAVVLPAKMMVQPGFEAAVMAKREARSADVTVMLERIAPQPAAAIDRTATVDPAAFVATKQRG